MMYNEEDMKKSLQRCASKRHYLSNPRRKSGVMGRHYSSQSLEEATPCHTTNGKSLTVGTLCSVVSRIPFAAGRYHHLSKLHSCREESRSCISAPTLTCGVTKIRPLRGRNLNIEHSSSNLLTKKNTKHLNLTPQLTAHSQKKTKR